MIRGVHRFGLACAALGASAASAADETGVLHIGATVAYRCDASTLGHEPRVLCAASAPFVIEHEQADEAADGHDGETQFTPLSVTVVY